tara:strand:+ start:358 stop:777 length:420 start_codon:yes stop_codon:yes gene_type:complete
MTFLYMGLGIVMITGISAMMQIASNLDNLMFISTFKENEYYRSSLPRRDRHIIEFLNNYSFSDSEVCKKVKENINDTFDAFYDDNEKSTPSESSLFMDSCILVDTEDNHRVLIKKNNLETFNLFSCYLPNNENYCPFEK